MSLAWMDPYEIKTRHQVISQFYLLNVNIFNMMQKLLNLHLISIAKTDKQHQQITTLTLFGTSQKRGQP